MLPYKKTGPDSLRKNGQGAFAAPSAPQRLGDATRSKLVRGRDQKRSGQQEIDYGALISLAKCVLCRSTVSAPTLASLGTTRLPRPKVPLWRRRDESSRF